MKLTEIRFLNKTQLLPDGCLKREDEEESGCGAVGTSTYCNKTAGENIYKEATEKFWPHCSVLFTSIKQSSIPDSSITSDINDRIDHLMRNLVSDNYSEEWEAKSELEQIILSDISDDLKFRIAESIIALSSGNETGKTELLSLFASEGISNSLKTRVVDLLINGLEGGNASVQRISCSVLSEFAESSAVPTHLKTKMAGPLIRVLESGNLSLRLIVEQAIFSLAGSSISTELKNGMVEPLINNIGDRGNYRMYPPYHAASALAELYGSNIPQQARSLITDRLFDTLLSEDSEKRCGSVLALGGLSRHDVPRNTRARIIAVLIASLDDEDFYVSIYSVSALREWLESDLSDELKVLIAESLIERFRSQLKEIQQGQEIENFSVVACNALNSLKYISAPDPIRTRMAEVFIEAFREGSTNAKFAALHFFRSAVQADISEGLETRIVETVIGGLDDENGSVRESALDWLYNSVCDSLISVDDQIRLVDPLIEFLGNENPELRQLAENTLKQISFSDIPVEIKNKIREVIL